MHVSLNNRLRVGAFHLPGHAMLHHARLEQEGGFPDQQAEGEFFLVDLALAYKIKKILQGRLHPLCFMNNDIQVFCPLGIDIFFAQDTGDPADGGNRISDDMDQLGGHMTQGGIPLRLDQQVLTPIEFLIHRLKLGDLALPLVVQMTLFNGKAGLAGKKLQGANMIILNDPSSHIIIGNDYPKGPPRRVQRHHDKGILIKDLEEFPGHCKRRSNHLHVFPTLRSRAPAVPSAAIRVASFQGHRHPAVFRRYFETPPAQHGIDQDVLRVFR